MTTTSPKPAPAAPKLTFHQRMVLGAVQAHYAAHGGVPTVADIQGRCARLTEAQVRTTLGALAGLGLIRRAKAGDDAAS